MFRKVPGSKLVPLGLEKLKDPLYRNALFIILTSGLGAIFGFLFWLVVAKFYTSEAVGLSASLLALAAFLGSLSSLGLGFGLINFLPSTSVGKSLFVSTSLTMAAIAALATLAVAFTFLEALGLLSPSLVFLKDRWPYVVVFISLTVGFALAPIAGSSFLAARKGSYLVLNSLLYNGLRLPLPVLFLPLLGSLGIFSSLGFSLVVSLLVTFLILIPRIYPDFLSSPFFRLKNMREILGYSAGNHVAALFVVLPAGVLPLLILGQLSASSSAHFYIAWMIASFLFAVPLASAYSLFVEGSRSTTNFVQTAIRSFRFGVFLLIPGVLFLFFAGPFILSLFGSEYVNEGLGLLRILVISAFFVAINTTFTSYLRIRKRIGELILLSAIRGVGILSLSYFLLGEFGLLGVGLAFLSTHAAISGYFLLRNIPLSIKVTKGLLRIDEGIAETRDRE